MRMWRNHANGWTREAQQVSTAINDGAGLGSIGGIAEEPTLPAGGNLPNILPISGKKSRSITAGTRCMVGLSAVITGSNAADPTSSLLSTNLE